MKGTIKVTIGRYKCRCSYRITGLTNPVKTETKTLSAKEGKNDDEKGNVG